MKEPLIIRECNMFASKASVQEVQEYMTMYAGKEHAFIAAMAIALTVNAIVRMMDEDCDGTAVAERARPLIERESA
jgi:hypothetical protein